MTTKTIDVKITKNMTMAELTPGNNEPLITPEELIAVELLSDMHGLYRAAQEKDFSDIDQNVAIGPASDSMEREFYVLKSINEDVALPTNYDQLLLKPKVENADFELILLKVPVLQEEQDFFRLPEGVEHWNDLVIEVFDRKGQISRYLFNSRGIEAYSDYTVLDESLNSDEPDNADLFSVLPEGVAKASMIPHLKPSQLRHMVFDQATLVRQSTR